MRLKLELLTQKGSILPFNYEYAISAWIYHNLAKADPIFATWLHDKGYSLADNHRRFKLFTFSQIELNKPYRFDKRRGFILDTGRASLTLSFLIDKAMQDFVIGLFKSQDLNIRIRSGYIDFKISEVEVLPDPVFTHLMEFRSRSPIFMSKYTETEKHPVYISPDSDPDYKTYFINNLIEKAKAIGEAPLPAFTDFGCQTKAHSKLLNIDGTNIRAFNFDFIIAAPPELIRIGYFAGFGGKNSSLGLGFCDVKITEPKVSNRSELKKILKNP